MYRIVGADQREYGPVAAEQIRQWIQEGRADGGTIARFEEGPWKPLATFPEFTDVFGSRDRNPPLTSAAPPRPPTNLPRSPKNHPLAVSGIILSGLAIVPCCCFGPLFGVVGLALSVIALIQIQKEPEKWDGKNLAIAGIVLGVASIALFLLMLLLNTGLAFRIGPRFRLG
jgi:hypothetical protein